MLLGGLKANCVDAQRGTSKVLEKNRAGVRSSGAVGMHRGSSVTFKVPNQTGATFSLFHSVRRSACFFLRLSLKNALAMVSPSS